MCSDFDDRECALTNYPQTDSVKNTQPMTRDGASAYLQCVMLPSDFKFPDDDELPLGCQIIRQRIKVLSLPIAFTDRALMAITCLARNPGGAVVLLCDCLSAYEGKTVDMPELTALYPFGFYNDKALVVIIDEWMKSGKHKWAHIY